VQGVVVELVVEPVPRESGHTASFESSGSSISLWGIGPLLAIPADDRSVTPGGRRAMFLIVARAAVRPRFVLPGILVAAISLWAGAARAVATPPPLPNMLTNGSFEHPRVADHRSHPFPSIPGWHLAFGPSIELQNHVAGAPRLGRQLAELDSDASSGIFQRVHTQPGGLYRLQFSASARPGTSSAENVLVVMWHRHVLARIVLDGRGLSHTVWHDYAFKVRATRRRTRLEFDDRGVSNSVGTYLDAVKVTPWRGHPTATPR
jgi:Protein of unknown function (DUF642)